MTLDSVLQAKFITAYGCLITSTDLKLVCAKSVIDISFSNRLSSNSTPQKISSITPRGKMETNTKSTHNIIRLLFFFFFPLKNKLFSNKNRKTAFEFPYSLPLKTKPMQS